MLYTHSRIDAYREKKLFWGFFLEKIFTTNSNDPTNTQVLVSIIIFQSKKLQSVKEMADSRTRTGNMQEDLKHLILPKLRH